MALPHVGIDFESFYNKKKTKANPRIIDISSLGTYNYAVETDIYLVGIYDGDQSFVGHPKDFDWKSLAGRNCVSHHALFDKTLYEVLVAKKIIDKIPRIGWWNCTANLSVYLRCGRSLKAAVKYLLNEDMCKDVRDLMAGLTPDQMRAMDATTPEFNNFYEEVCDYAIKDGVQTWRIWNEHAHKWPEFERQLSLITIESCLAGIPVDLKYMRRGIDTLERKRFTAIDKLPWMNDMTIDDPKPGSKICLGKACRDAGIDTPSSIAEGNESYIRWNEKYGETVPWIKAMKDISSINIMLKKFKTVQERVKGNGRFPYGLKYGGAHTMRWSGADGYSVHGMEKYPVCGIDTRRKFIASRKHKLIIADKSQIEARITPFLAGDTETIAMMAKGMSPYVVHAVKTLGWDPAKDIQCPKEGDKNLYSLAKARVLGLGFGCGAQTFISQAAVYGIELTLKESKKTVKDFRDQNPHIVELWEMLGKDLMRSANDGETYQIELPSGRCLEFFDLSVVDGDYGKQVQAHVSRDSRKWSYLYGGKLTENLVQATARDVFGEDLVRLNEEGHEILFHTHDEVILNVKESVDVKEIEEIMSICPTWLKGCPVGAEAVESEYYKKI